jgi:hypothetical protein
MRFILWASCAAGMYAVAAGCSGYGAYETNYGASKGQRLSVRLLTADLYDSSDMSGARIATLARNDQVDVLEDPVTVNGKEMVRVKRVRGSETGWVTLSSIAVLTIGRAADKPGEPKAGAGAATKPAIVSGTRAVAADGVFLMAGAAMDAEKIDALPKGSLVRVEGTPVRSGGIDWTPVATVGRDPEKRGFLPAGALGDAPGAGEDKR